MTNPTQNPKLFLNELFETAVRSAMPSERMGAYLPEPPKGRTLVIAAGKAAGSMARAVEEHWPEQAPLTGIALTRYGHGVDCTRIEVIEASHPVPDDRGYEAALRILAEVESLGADDLLLFLVSGGGSALMTAPAVGVTLSEKKAINRALLMSGAPIGEMNVVRKHLSSVKGGRLAKLAHPARIVTLAISDVPGDDPSTIASGPTVPDQSTCSDALSLLDHYKISVSDDARSHLQNSANETPKPGDVVFQNTRFEMVARPADMLRSVEAFVLSQNLKVQNLGADIEGEARDVAKGHADIALDNTSDKMLILSGGETTVTVSDAVKPGKGGRNCEYLLALAIALNGEPTTYALAADTDGIDGSETNAGAVITPDTLLRGQEMGMDAQDYLDRHDSFSYFEALGDLITTGPTRTNVNDFRAIWTGVSSTN